MNADHAATLLRDRWDSMPAAMRCGLVAMLEAVEKSPEWPSVSQAAAQLVGDVDGLNLQAARVRLGYAIKKGWVISVGEGTARRVDPGSLGIYRLAAREKNLAKFEGAK